MELPIALRKSHDIAATLSAHSSRLSMLAEDFTVLKEVNTRLDLEAKKLRTTSKRDKVELETVKQELGAVKELKTLRVERGSLAKNLPRLWDTFLKKAHEITSFLSTALGMVSTDVPPFEVTSHVNPETTAFIGWRHNFLSFRMSLRKVVIMLRFSSWRTL